MSRNQNVNSVKLLQNKASNLTEKGKELGKQAANSMKSKIGNVGEKIKNATNQIPTAGLEAVGAKASQFAESNTAISKFIFILFLLIVTLFLFNVGVMALQAMMGYNKNPILLDGMVTAKKTTLISVNPNEPGSVPVYRSVNEDQGVEFTWNVWFFIDGLNPKIPTYSRIFSKGSENASLDLSNFCSSTATDDESCRNIFNSSPGLFISQAVKGTTMAPFIDQEGNPSKNHVKLVLVMNTYIKKGNATDMTNQTNFAESITIDNVPMKKWVCATIRVQQTTVDIYINGTMTQRKKLANLPKQNYYDVKVGDTTDGFDGAISSLRYYSKALSYDDIQSLFGKGPNLKSLDMTGLAGKDYLSTNWYYKG